MPVGTVKQLANTEGPTTPTTTPTTTTTTTPTTMTTTPTPTTLRRTTQRVSTMKSSIQKDQSSSPQTPKTTLQKRLTLDGELDATVNDEVDATVDGEIDAKVDSELDATVNDEVDTTVDGEIEDIDNDARLFIISHHYLLIKLSSKISHTLHLHSYQDSLQFFRFFWLIDITFTGWSTSGV